MMKTVLQQRSEQKAKWFSLQGLPCVAPVSSCVWHNESYNKFDTNIEEGGGRS